MDNCKALNWSDYVFGLSIQLHSATHVFANEVKFGHLQMTERAVVLLRCQTLHPAGSSPSLKKEGKGKKKERKEKSIALSL